MNTALSIASQNGLQITLQHTPGSGPGIVFCSGFKSDMQGNKACFLDRICKQQRWQFTRFDYRGHGLSDGEFSQCNLDHWIEDTCSVLDQICTGPQILVGSSMGAWIALRAALARPERVVGLLTIAAAPDFTEELIWNELSAKDQAALRTGSSWSMPSQSDPKQDYTISMPLINSGRRNAILNGPIDVRCPVRLLHGCADEDVPYSLSLRLLDLLESPDVTLNLKKNADHRFSDEDCLDIIENTLCQLHGQLTTNQAATPGQAE